MSKAKRVVSVPRTPAEFSLDIVSHGRRGSTPILRLSNEQIEQVARTVRRTPEVMVKVSGGARDVAGAKAHFNYIGRHGKLAIETDEGRELLGKGAGAALVADWNLDLSKGQYRPKPDDGGADTRPKAVHNIVLSMPKGTPPQAVLVAARKFAREHFALQYRYAMVLHTDQSHPHVHLVVKAEHEFEPGKRLYIRKATLRQWREDFAAFLREQGVAANATPAPLRGRVRTGKKDPIHQRLKSLAAFEAMPEETKRLRKRPEDSTFMRAKVQAVAKEIERGRLAAEPGRSRLEDTHRLVRRDWLAAATLRRENRNWQRMSGPSSTGCLRCARTRSRSQPASSPRSRQVGATQRGRKNLRRSPETNRGWCPIDWLRASYRALEPRSRVGGFAAKRPSPIRSASRSRACTTNRSRSVSSWKLPWA